MKAAEQQLEMTKKQSGQAAANRQTELARLVSFSSSPAVPQHPNQKLEARIAELEARFEVRLWVTIAFIAFSSVKLFNEHFSPLLLN